MEKWFLKNKKADFTAISQSYGISELLAKLAVNRDIRDGKELDMYLNPTIDKMHSPNKMKDIREAVDILENKIKEGKFIRIVGDYDVDGIISVYLLYIAITRCKGNVDYVIPDRIKDGYGINTSIIETAKEAGVDTIITCDNGISAIEQIDAAKCLGMTVIITDHHDVPYEDIEEGRRYIIPRADVVVNPKQVDCQYPCEYLCGAGVVYKLIEVLYERFLIPKEEVVGLMEFTAIASICDVVDLMDENRVIVKNGLEALNRTTNYGLRALIEGTGLEGKTLSVYHVGFVIGPCMNASGRLDSANKSVNLLLSGSQEEAKKLAMELIELNAERKELTQTNFVKSIDIIESSNIIEDKVLVVYLEDCHESLAGIIAGRLKDRYYKPSIVLTKAEEGVKGSGRSIEEYNMFEELTKCKELLNKYGGHPMAAGLSLNYDNVDRLREKLNEVTELTEDDLYLKVSIDHVLPLDVIDIPLIEEISKLEPYGKSNPKPIFAVKEVSVVKGFKLGVNQNVLKLSIRTESNRNMTAMYFGNIGKFEEYIEMKYGSLGLNNIYNGTSDVKLDITFYPDINEYNGYKNVQVIIQNFK